MNTQQSSPISIQNGRRNGVFGENGSRSRLDTINSIKQSSSVSSSHCENVSPGLASPTPPTFVPDGSHQTSRIDKYLLVEHIEGQNAGNVYRAVNVHTEDEYICKIYERSEYFKVGDIYFRLMPHRNISNIVDVILGSTKAYAFFNPGVPISNCQGKSSGFQAENLHSFVRAEKYLREEVAAPLFQQVVNAVAHCHTNNVVIKDLKLRKFIFWDLEKQEVMIESVDDAYVLDIDDDKISDRHGCPAYVSPEVLALNTSDKSTSSQKAYSGKASNVWSLGIMLYTMLVGRYPFREADPASMFAKVRRCQFALPDRLSSEAKDLVRNLLRRHPDDRLSANHILLHPWIKRAGQCCDVVRHVMPIGSGGDSRSLDRDYLASIVRRHQLAVPVALCHAHSYSDQVVPESVATADVDDDDMMFNFGE